MAANIHSLFIGRTILIMTITVYKDFAHDDDDDKNYDDAGCLGLVGVQ